MTFTTRRLLEVMDKAMEIAENAPELNMNNFDTNQVQQPNTAMIQVYNTLMGDVEAFRKGVFTE